MAAVPSTMLELGTLAPPIDLPTADGTRWSLADQPPSSALVVLFICNHCPYVKHIAPVLADVTRRLQADGATVVAVNSNDAERYPDDGPEAMGAEVAERGYAFPYLVDADQAVAHAYRAACTPDCYVFDGERRLVYRGQFDDSRPGNDVDVTGADLDAAVRAVLTGAPVPEPQHPSIGCSIKWRPGNEPPWFG